MMTWADEVAKKAVTLVEENRVITHTHPHQSRVSIATVAGHHNHYTVIADHAGLTCDCPATDKSGRYCSHMLAAMIRWAER